MNLLDWNRKRIAKKDLRNIIDDVEKCPEIKDRYYSLPEKIIQKDINNSILDGLVQYCQDYAKSPIKVKPVLDFKKQGVGIKISIDF